MHIADGIIPAGICAAADAVAMGGVYLGGRRIDAEEIPKMGVMAAALFTVSLIHFPIAGTSIHLGLFGLAGILLGLRSFPVVFITLLFQSLIFQHGGLVSVGLNSINMGLGALLGWVIWKMKPLHMVPRAFLAGFAGIILPAVLMALEFRLAEYGKGIFYLLSVYLPVAAIEGVITAGATGFLIKAKPELLGEK
ncbi:MAG: cobalt transporter CbiM [Acidobacteria bacterium]|nr:cobalt transporter CbiM [Acidobacteriota bacterium]